MATRANFDGHSPLACDTLQLFFHEFQVYTKINDGVGICIDDVMNAEVRFFSPTSGRCKPLSLPCKLTIDSGDLVLLCLRIHAFSLLECWLAVIYASVLGARDTFSRRPIRRALFARFMAGIKNAGEVGYQD